jgi:hypothetical protein
MYVCMYNWTTEDTSKLVSTQSLSLEILKDARPPIYNVFYRTTVCDLSKLAIHIK